MYWLMKCWWLNYEFGIDIDSGSLVGLKRLHRVVERDPYDGSVLRYVTWGWITLQWSTLPPAEYTKWPTRLRYGKADYVEDEADAGPAYRALMRVR
jgi:hypothetical protein